jgi:two-component system response regulator RpfG
VEHLDSIAARNPVCLLAADAAAAASVAGAMGARSSWDIRIFDEPQSALEWCAAHGPRLVLADCSVGKVASLEFALRARNAARGTPPLVAFLAAHEDAPLQELAAAHGVVAVIRKPGPGEPWGADLVHLLRVVDQAHAMDRNTAVRPMPQLPEDRLEAADLAMARDAARLLRRQLCRDSVLMQETLAGCATASGLGADATERLLSAWTLYAGLPIRKPQAPSPAEGSQRLEEERQLRGLAARALAQCPPIFNARKETPALWALQLALHGGEHWDGSGRPLGLRGREIPLPARLVHLVNSYGLLRCASALGGAQLPASAALVRMEASCHQEFDPTLFEALKTATQRDVQGVGACA